MSNLIVPVYGVKGMQYELYFKEVNDENIEEAISVLEDKIDENRKALSIAKQIFKDRITEEIEKNIKIEINNCNYLMKKKIEELREMLISK